MQSLPSRTIPFPHAVDNPVFTLPNEISAMQIVPLDDKVYLSPVSRLPRGARIEACGQGFDKNTVKVFYEGHFYFVFLQDLEAPRKTAVAAS